MEGTTVSKMNSTFLKGQKDTREKYWRYFYQYRNIIYLPTYLPTYLPVYIRPDAAQNLELLISEVRQSLFGGQITDVVDLCRPVGSQGFRVIHNKLSLETTKDNFPLVRQRERQREREMILSQEMGFTTAIEQTFFRTKHTNSQRIAMAMSLTLFALKQEL